MTAIEGIILLNLLYLDFLIIYVLLKRNDYKKRDDYSEKNEAEEHNLWRTKDDYKKKKQI